MTEKTDMLETLFNMQLSLNDFTFMKQNITDNKGQLLTSKTIYDSANQEHIGSNTECNEWLTKYLMAMDDESRELKEELLWKWWSKDKLDIQNIRVEIIDQLHFWISLANASGMTAQDVFNIYVQKNEVNYNRQKQEYSKANKDESDNKSINI